MHKLEDIIEDLKTEKPEVSVWEVIECLEQAQDTISDLQDKVEELKKFVELVEGALGCTDGDDIRAHIEPELAALKQEVEEQYEREQRNRRNKL